MGRGISEVKSIVELIIDKIIERSLVPALKRAGASGIISYPLNKVIH
jgi:ATP phosphoribosyltransferase